jgi:hypothetical protein
MDDLLPYEKPRYTVGHPIIPFRKVLDGVLYVQRTGCLFSKDILKFLF